MAKSRLDRALKMVGNEAGGFLLLLFEKLARVLPERAFLRMDRLIGFLARLPSSKSRGLPMMKAVLGADSRSEPEWEDLWRRHVRAMGRMSLQQVLSFTTPPDRLLAEIDVFGLEYLRTALAAGKGAVLLCSHTGGFLEQLVLAGSLFPKALAYGNRLPSETAEKIFTQFLTRVGIDRQLVSQGKSAGAKAVLDKNGLVVTFCDVTTVKRNNCWVPFGQAESLVNLGPELLALRNEAPMIVLTSRKYPDGRTSVWVHPPLCVSRTADLVWDAWIATCQAMTFVTAEVRRHPEQWWQWDIGRFRTPDGRTSGNVSSEIYDFTGPGQNEVRN